MEAALEAGRELSLMIQPMERVKLILPEGEGVARFRSVGFKGE
jgi:hypothetical protein